MKNIEFQTVSEALKDAELLFRAGWDVNLRETTKGTFQAIKQPVGHVECPEHLKQDFAKVQAIWYAVIGTEYDKTKAALNLCGITSFDTAIPQGWADKMREMGVDPVGYVWDYSGENRLFGAPLNVPAFLWAQLRELMQDYKLRAMFEIWQTEHVERYDLKNQVTTF